MSISVQEEALSCQPATPPPVCDCVRAGDQWRAFLCNCPWKKQLDEEGTAAASSSLGRQVGAGASRTGGGEGPWRARAALDVVTTRRQEQEAQLLPLNQPARAADAKVVSEAGLEMVSEEEDRPAPGCACGRRRR